MRMEISLPTKKEMDYNDMKYKRCTKYKNHDVTYSDLTVEKCPICKNDYGVSDPLEAMINKQLTEFLTLLKNYYGGESEL